MSERDEFLEVARRIGERLVASALWEGGVCTWRVMEADRSRPSRTAIPQIAGGAVYEGTAGIALFLAELFRHTGDPAVARAAAGAIGHALASPEAAGGGTGFHAGALGIACAAARASEILERPELSAAARAVLTRLAGEEKRDAGLDVISGTAGAIGPLLRLRNVLDRGLALEMAARMGDHLIAVARREPVGWSWGAPHSTSHVRNLTGLAHGAAGFAHGLLELHAATGLSKYRYAAEQAFLYENQFFDPAVSNWPDLRYRALSEYTLYGRTAELEALLAGGGRLPEYRITFMTAWCHGAPGIGLARLRAFQLLGDAAHRRDAEAAVAATLASLEQESQGNFSLCHGIAGNCETLLFAAQVLGRPELRERVESCAREGARAYEHAGHAWPCGTVDSVSDPGLMLGEAGIGYFFLRLYAPDTPSILLPCGDDTVAQAPPGDRSAEALRAETVGAYFGRTLRILETLDGGPLEATLPSAATREPAASDVEAARRTIEGRIAAEDDAEQRALLEDAFLLDRVRHALTLELDDFTAELLERLQRPDAADVLAAGARLELAPSVRLVRTARDWDAWLADAPAARTAAPKPDPATFLLFRAGNRIAVQRLGPLAEAVLRGIAETAGVDEIVDRLAGELNGADPADRTRSRELVSDQIAQAYRAGIIRASKPPAYGAGGRERIGTPGGAARPIHPVQP